MAGRVFTLVGAGSVRCAPAVLSTLAQLPWPDEGEVRLFDANEERLDLMDRLARALFDSRGLETALKSTPELAEALAESETVVVSLNEDGARRMAGDHNAPSLDNFVDDPDPWELRRGDFNRPTPPDRLSSQTRAMLERPIDLTRSRGEVLRTALEQVVANIPGNAAVVSLVRDSNFTFSQQVTVLSWPTALSSSEISLAPHQILRWALKQEPLDDLLALGIGNPLAELLAVD